MVRKSVPAVAASNSKKCLARCGSAPETDAIKNMRQDDERNGRRALQNSTTRGQHRSLHEYCRAIKRQERKPELAHRRQGNEEGQCCQIEAKERRHKIERRTERG